jgi:salicylate hydroxylase
MHKLKVSIVGAGVSGLSLAHTLIKNGITPIVFERASAVGTVNESLMKPHFLLQSSQIALQKLGILDRIQPISQKVNSLTHYSRNKHLGDSTIKPFIDDGKEYYTSTIESQRLVQTLVDTLPKDIIQYNRLVTGVQQVTKPTVSFNDGSSLESDVIIACDGPESTLRVQLFNTPPLERSHIRIFALAAPRTDPLHTVTQIIGDGLNIGVTPYGNDHTLAWVMYLSEGPHQEYTTDTAKQEIKSMISGIHNKAFNKLVDSATVVVGYPIMNQQMLNEKWYQGNVAFLGSSARQSPVNAGLGLDQNILDAYVLGSLLAKKSPLEAFQEYQNKRLPRAIEIERVGKYMEGFELSTSFLKRIAVENMMKIMHSTGVVQKQSDKMWKQDSEHIHSV